jgi:hypothetical protein
VEVFIITDLTYSALLDFRIIAMRVVTYSHALLIDFAISASA